VTNRRRGNAAPSRRHSRTRRITPRGHWLLLSVLAVTLSTALLQGYTHHTFGIASDEATGARGHDGAVPSQVVHGGPVIANAATTPHTARMKARTIALTFDDGHQIGIHAFTHPDLARLAPWQRSLELRETQLAVAGATGVTTALLRPPFYSRNDALDDADWSVMEQADAAGYVTVLATRDAEDWQRSGVDLRVPAGAEVPGTDFPRQDPGLPQQYPYETEQLY
jgi:peptidoglycan/xylan/chitin deacetylase (PgdA/CDA1 family)